ncbi:VOC family protein [Alteromonas arenosi]
MNQVIMNSTDIEKSKQFYSALGFTLIVATEHYLRFACPDNGATFSLSLADKASDGMKVYFEEPDLDRKVAELEQHGFVFEHGPEDKHYLWREAELCDPSGNKLVLYWAGDNRLNPPWRVSAE